MMTRLPVIGFITPPDWIDPSPMEFSRLNNFEVITQQCPLHMPGLDWRLSNVAKCEPALFQAAEILTDLGCDLIVVTGTPFAWAGLHSIDDARERQHRLQKEVGLPVIFSAIAMLEEVYRNKFKQLVINCSYYSDEWRAQWSDFVQASGFQVIAAENFLSLGLSEAHSEHDKSQWSPHESQIMSSLQSLNNIEADAILLGGAAVRTLSLETGIRSKIKRPVIAADRALYQAISEWMTGVAPTQLIHQQTSVK
ncbi:MAG: maleate cis-trans isomerase [Halieaceae bacterium]|jgi:maleate cis-trans isomerase